MGTVGTAMTEEHGSASLPSGGVQRVGWGYDAHRFNHIPPVVLGGVVVDQTRGIEATSDGDVVAHAVIDALLGAAVLGDIGSHFPSDDSRWRDIESMQMLTTATGMVRDQGWAPSHVDVTVIADNLKVDPHRSPMRHNLATALELDVTAVSVKATTTDGLISAAREGLMVTAVATLTDTSRESANSVP